MKAPPDPVRGTTAPAKGGRTGVFEDTSCLDRTSPDRPWLHELLRPLLAIRMGRWSH